MNKTPALLLSLVFATLSYGADATPLSLKDFTDTNGEAPSAGWTQEADGTIHLKGKGGSLISKLECKSFELEWEWKVSDKGNNGIKYWVTKVANKEWLGIEYQMIDDNGHPDGLRGGSHTTASIYDIKAPVAEKGAKPAGEWNKSKIIVEEGKIQHWLNGVLACEADTRTEEWKERIAASKFKSKEGFAPGGGRIMLTDHNDETWFRNLSIKVK